MKYQCDKTPCIIEGKPPVDLHHVKTRKASGTDDVWNLMPLQHKYHQEIHSIGLKKMSEKYPAVKEWLDKNNWVFCDLLKKWSHDE